LGWSLELFPPETRERVTQENFITELRYIRNVSAATLEIYAHAFKAFAGATDSRATVVQRIAELRSRGVLPVSVNTYLRCVNAYFNWRHIEHQQERIRIPRLKEEQKLISTFTPEQVARVVNGKPVGRNETRARMASITALDTGMRIQELLNLRRADADFDNLLFRVHGKGHKQRLVPMSIELRKLLFRYVSLHQFDRVFATARGTSPTQRNLSRDFKLFCSRLAITGVRISFHTLRHTFAVEYLKAGGNVLYLQRILGHTSLEMTNRYCRSLGIDDLKAVHSGLSLLSARR
jgi:site-specific recombinase XerD